MITLYRPAYYAAPRAPEFTGRSSDIKPTNVSNGATYHELDTGKEYRFDKQNSKWYEWTGGSIAPNIAVEAVAITANGTTTAPSGKAYSPITVNVPSKPEQTKTVDLSMASGNQTISPDSGKVLFSVVVNKPATLVADNIKNGVAIGGVTGTLTPAKAEETKTVDLSMASGDQTITSSDGKVLTQVKVTKPSTLVPNNIKNGISIGGVVGTYDPKQYQNIEWHQCPELVRNYLANVTYDPSDYSTSQIANYAPATAVVSNYKPIGQAAGGVTYYNEVPNVLTPFAGTDVAGGGAQAAGRTAMDSHAG